MCPAHFGTLEFIKAGDGQFYILSYCSISGIWQLPRLVTSKPLCSSSASKSSPATDAGDGGTL